MILTRWVTARGTTTTWRADTHLPPKIPRVQPWFSQRFGSLQMWPTFKLFDGHIHRPLIRFLGKRLPPSSDSCSATFVPSTPLIYFIFVQFHNSLDLIQQHHLTLSLASTNSQSTIPNRSPLIPVWSLQAIHHPLLLRSTSFGKPRHGFGHHLVQSMMQR